jgi:uncharacterized protein (TIGR02996 family)
MPAQQPTSLPAALRGLLDGIKASPEDDAPRLVLADWLEENAVTEADHARAEHVRVQVRWAALPTPNGPPSLTGKVS